MFEAPLLHDIHNCTLRLEQALTTLLIAEPIRATILQYIQFRAAIGMNIPGLVHLHFVQAIKVPQREVIWGSDQT
jgi:hypothetical protein